MSDLESSQSDQTGVVYVLCNGSADEYAVMWAQDEPGPGEDIWVARISGVPADVVEELMDGAEPSKVWDEMKGCPMQVISRAGFDTTTV